MEWNKGKSTKHGKNKICILFTYWSLKGGVQG